MRDVVRSGAMRDVSSLDPMWDPETPRSVRAQKMVRGVARVAKIVAPFVVTWAKGMKPQLRFAWGSTEYQLHSDGIAAHRRRGPGFEDNPRSNYNERVRMRQERTQATTPETRATTSAAEAHPKQDTVEVDSNEPPPSLSGPKANTERTHISVEETPLDLSPDALRAAVDEAMGGSSDAEPIKDPASLKLALAQVRASLQALDDVKDWSAVETIDEELYKLHRAVEYKMRNHKASEAKSKLDDLFK